MLGADLIKAERGIYYMVLDVLQKEQIPEDLWPLVVDSAAGHVKDLALTKIAMSEIDWRQKALDAEAKEVRDACGDAARQDGEGD